MTALNPGFLGTFRQYAGKLRTLRNEARTQRFLEFAARRHSQGHRLARPLPARRPQVSLTPASAGAAAAVGRRSAGMLTGS